MAITISKLVIKSSQEPGSAPPAEFLDFGELGLNFADGVLYYKNSLGVIKSIVDVDLTPYAPITALEDYVKYAGASQSINSEIIFNQRVTLKAVGMTTVHLTSGMGITWNLSAGNIADVTLSGDSSLANPTGVAPGTYIIRVTQDGTGGRTLSFGSNFKSPDGEPFEIALGPNAISILTFLNIAGPDLYLVGQKDFI